MNSLNTILGFVGPGQYVIIAVVILFFFGGKKIPELMKGIGSGINEFKKGLAGDEDSAKKKIEEEDKK